MQCIVQDSDRFWHAANWSGTRFLGSMITWFLDPSCGGGIICRSCGGDIPYFVDVVTWVRSYICLQGQRVPSRWFSCSKLWMNWKTFGIGGTDSLACMNGTDTPLLRGVWHGSSRYDSSKMALAPLLFTKKQLLQENVWQGSFGEARAGAGEEPCQTSP